MGEDGREGEGGGHHFERPKKEMKKKKHTQRWEIRELKARYNIDDDKQVSRIIWKTRRNPINPTNQTKFAND